MKDQQLKFKRKTTTQDQSQQNKRNM